MQMKKGFLPWQVRSHSNDCHFLVSRFPLKQLNLKGTKQCGIFYCGHPTAFAYPLWVR